VVKQEKQGVAKEEKEQKRLSEEENEKPNYLGSFFCSQTLYI
jgi:hypothetical protein